MFNHDVKNVDNLKEIFKKSGQTAMEKNNQKRKDISNVEDLFIDAWKIAEQNETEDHFRGNILSSFAKIETGITSIIAFHNSKYPSKQTEINEKTIFKTNWKILQLQKILRCKKYQTTEFDFTSILTKINECKDLRNQLAHNMVYPESSFKNAKKGDKTITMIFFKGIKREKVEFTKEKQEELKEEFHRVYKVIKNLYEFIAIKNGEYSQLAI